MGSYTVSSGVIHAPVKVVLYGPEGIGKSTFAAKFPSPVFIDTEGGTKSLREPSAAAHQLGNADGLTLPGTAGAYPVWHACDRHRRLGRRFDASGPYATVPT